MPIPAGDFSAGSPADDAQAEDDERPRHRVRISRPFYLGAYEVTQAEYARVMGANPSWFSPTGPGRLQVLGLDTNRHPVDMLSWDDAIEFCRRLSRLPDEQRAGRVYRLPTEAEWEYACRAGTATRFHTGDLLSPRQANVGDAAPRRELGRTVAVGSYEPNALGLYDMHGNVWEWVADIYCYDYYRDCPAVDPPGPSSGTGRVVRGGDWWFDVRNCRSANRDLTRASRRDLGNGFRVACDQRRN